MSVESTERRWRVGPARLTGGLYVAYIGASAVADKLGHCVFRSKPNTDSGSPRV